MQRKYNEVLKKPIVIIGAGKTGRGFLARLAFLSNMPVIFLDKDLTLVSNLNTRGQYRIDFFGERRGPLIIKDFSAYAINSESAEKAIASADIVFTSVGASNLGLLSAKIAKGLKNRDEYNCTNPLYIVTAENAISPAKKLSAMIRNYLGDNALESAKFLTTEAAIFCTTIENECDPLSIKSEDLDFLPYDAKPIGEILNIIHGAQAEYNFDRLLKRKIYTYNCASACIAYLGHLKKYTSFPEAANDKIILSILHRLYKETGEAICKEYGYTELEQAEFALNSLRKFQNYEIKDSIERNARDVIRKLMPDERIVGPAILMQKHNIISIVLPIVYAAALFYRQESEFELISLLEKGGISCILENVSHISAESIFGEKVIEYYEVFNEFLRKDADPINGLLQRGLE